MPSRLDALVARLEQPFEFDPATLAALVDATTPLTLKDKESVILLALARFKTPVDRMNLKRFIEHLVKADLRLTTILRRSIKRKGRCPAGGAHTVIGYATSRGPVEEIRSHHPWQGTVVTMIVDLHNKLPLGDVYKTLPLPEGMSEADFFDE